MSFDAVQFAIIQDFIDTTEASVDNIEADILVLKNDNTNELIPLSKSNDGFLYGICIGQFFIVGLMIWNIVYKSKSAKHLWCFLFCSCFVCAFEEAEYNPNYLEGFPPIMHQYKLYSNLDSMTEQELDEYFLVSYFGFSGQEYFTVYRDYEKISAEDNGGVAKITYSKTNLSTNDLNDFYTISQEGATIFGNLGDDQPVLYDAILSADVSYASPTLSAENRVYEDYFNEVKYYLNEKISDDIAITLNGITTEGIITSSDALVLNTEQTYQEYIDDKTGVTGNTIPDIAGVDVVDAVPSLMTVLASVVAVSIGGLVAFHVIRQGLGYIKIK